MSADFNIETLVEQENSFVHAISVGFGPPIHKFVTSCIEWERKGIPFVVRGIPLDAGSEPPFDNSTEWLKTLSSTGGKSSRNLSETDFKMSF